jgi:hypothetical protein
LKAIESILKGQQGKWFFFPHLVDILYSLSLEFVVPSVGKMWRKFSCKKACQVVYKSLYTHFLHFWFLTKISMHNYICMWQNHHHHENIIWIIQYLSFKFILFKFYIWKIIKTKSLNLMVKKWYLDCEYALECLNSLVELLIELFQKMVVITIFNC